MTPTFSHQEFLKLANEARSHIKNWTSFTWTCSSCKSSSTWACLTTKSCCSQSTACSPSCCMIRKTARFPLKSTALVSGHAGLRSFLMSTSLPSAPATLIAPCYHPAPSSAFLARCCSFLSRSLPFSAPSQSLRPFSALTLISRWSATDKFFCAVLPSFFLTQFAYLPRPICDFSSPQVPNFEFPVFL